MRPTVKETPVQSFRESLHCGECGGEMRPTGMCLTSHPAQYPHVCTVCGKETVGRHPNEVYPRVIFK